jgi:hypothetical protein
MQLITTLHLEVVTVRNTALHLEVVTQDLDDIDTIMTGINAIVKLIIALHLEVVIMRDTALHLEVVLTDCTDDNMIVIAIIVIHLVVATPALEDIIGKISRIGVPPMEVVPVMIPVIRQMMTVNLAHKDALDNTVVTAKN